VKHRIAAALLIALLTSLLAFSQETKTVEITEPAVYKLADLFAAADVVAVVRIVSGDAEHYDSAVYKGEVIRSFKGSTKGEILYFGPFMGERIGWEYVLFLRNSKQLLIAKSDRSPYGSVTYHKVFDEGYSSMETSYECVFKGKDIAEQCAFAVRVCTDYIKLAKTTRTSPPLDEETSFGCRWVRKDNFEQVLKQMSKTPSN
jgi:hypothetical protein